MHTKHISYNATKTTVRTHPWCEKLKKNGWACVLNCSVPRVCVSYLAVEKGVSP